LTPSNKPLPSKRNPASTTRPLGLKVGKGPAAVAANIVQLTDNSKGWAEVASIPVPPSADKRNFSISLGQSPTLVNGGVITVASTPLVGSSSNALIKGPEESNDSRGLSFNYQSTVTALPKKIIEIEWYGARLALECTNIVYQPANQVKETPAWLLLELPILDRTQAPAWTPPVAQLGQDGKIHAPEFVCTYEGQDYVCQVLNIDIYDSQQRKRTFIFRVLE